MRLLIDYHHSDLFESWQLMLEDRYDNEVYRPIGMEWFKEDYWQFEKKWHGDAVARQYLQFWDKDQLTIDGHYERADWTHPGRIHKMVTLEQAREMDWDIVIATVPDNEPGLHRFAKEEGAHFGVQAGNHLHVSDWGKAEFALLSTTLPYVPPVPHITYRQEFSLADFRYEPPPMTHTVASFIQCLPENQFQYQEFLKMARSMPEHQWRIYGSYGSFQGHDEFEAGNLPTTVAVAEHMRNTDVIWHTKAWSDGYGHVIHNAFATGRPVVGDYQYYKDKMAGPLWVDGVTCFDTGAHDAIYIRESIRHLFEEPAALVAMCEASRKRFDEIVDFADDAYRMQDLLANIVA